MSPYLTPTANEDVPPPAPNTNVTLVPSSTQTDVDLAPTANEDVPPPTPGDIHTNVPRQMWQLPMINLLQVILPNILR